MVICDCDTKTNEKNQIQKAPKKAGLLEFSYEYISNLNQTFKTNKNLKESNKSRENNYSLCTQECSCST